MIDLSHADERRAAAGEYVLGTLDADDQAAFEAALAHDRELQAEVYAWQDHLLSLSRQAPPAEPRPQLWQRIDTTLGAMAALPTRAAATARPATPPWWQRLGLWQGLSALAVAASLFLAMQLVQRLAVPEAGPRYLAVLQSPDKQATGWVVELQAKGMLRLVPVADSAAVPADRALQFWTKPQGAAGPTSLGLVRAGQTVELPASSLPAVGEQQLFEITLEPAAGSPIGRPTGPILYVGRTVRL
ncbi:MAG: anti-sigma factor [Burkholderiales bacterium]